MNSQDWKKTETGYVHAGGLHAIRESRGGYVDLGFADSDGNLDREKTSLEFSTLDAAVAAYEAGALKSAPEWVDPENPEQLAGAVPRGSALQALGVAVSDLGYVSSSDVARLLGVNRRTVVRWVESGKLAGFRTPTGRVRVNVEAVEALLAA